ncbi:MAG: CocE/NonD family hydrolase, partial [Oceanococcaceae bacterium]
LDPEQTWHIYGNGVHGYGLGSPTVVATAERFLRHFLLGEDNGFHSTPKVQIEREVAFAQPARWIDSLPAWPAQTQPAELYFSPEGTLDSQRPELSESFSYLYPLPAPSMTAALAASTENQTYALPIAPGGAALFTTPPLEHDLSLLGPSRVDLWLSSTATDTDVQISLTEVRPDGQEMFVQRGWLRASHRAMDVRENRATAPYHWFSEATQSPLLPDEPTLLSIEILPVAHVFRAGSSLRLRVEAPVGTTGFRQLEFNPTPAVNTVHVGPQHLSRITLSLWPGHQAPVDYPDCANQANQPCRDSDAAQPSGSLRVPTALAATSPQGGTVQAGPQSLSLHNSSAEPHYLRAVTLNLPQAHTLYSASMVLDGEATQVLAPKHQARFELPDRLLAPGERVELHWTLQASQQAAYWPLLNSAHAGLNPIGLSAFGSVLAWLGLAWIGRPRRGRGLPLLLILSGLLVACQGGRSELPSTGADEPQSSSSVLHVEVVNRQGQFVLYSP